jgi:RNA polymerase sigma-B factor
VRANQRALLRRYHEDGDLEARRQLIEQAMPLVRALAARYSYRGEQFEDLVQIGAIGLIKAIDRFDVDRGVDLTAYAAPNIVGEIKRHFRDVAWAVHVPRGLRELNVRLSRIVEQLTAELGRSPTNPELAKAANVDEERVVEALESGRAYAPLSLSVPTDDTEIDRDRLGWLATDETEYDVAEDRALLATGFNALGERERQILRLSFFEGMTQAQIAQVVGLSQMHISRLIRSALAEIGEAIAVDGETLVA